MKEDEFGSANLSDTSSQTEPGFGTELQNQGGGPIEYSEWKKTH